MTTPVAPPRIPLVYSGIYIMLTFGVFSDHAVAQHEISLNAVRQSPIAISTLRPRDDIALRGCPALPQSV
jgi:hypothetical protein